MEEEGQNWPTSRWGARKIVFFWRQDSNPAHVRGEGRGGGRSKTLRVAAQKRSAVWRDSRSKPERVRKRDQLREGWGVHRRRKLAPGWMFLEPGPADIKIVRRETDSNQKMDSRGAILLNKKNHAAVSNCKEKEGVRNRVELGEDFFKTLVLFFN